MNFSDPVSKQIDSKKIKKQKKINRKLYIYSFVVVFLLLLAGGIFLFSKAFAVKKIEIIGAERFDSEPVRSYVSESVGENGFALMLENNSLKTFNALFKGRLSEVEGKLKFEFPYLSKASVKYEFPDRLKITVEERNAVLFIKEHDDYICVDNKGFVISIMTQNEFDEFTENDTQGTSVVRGIAPDEYKIGYEINADDKDIIYNTIKLASAINENQSLMGKINVIDVTAPEEIFFISNPSLTVKFGSFDGMYDKVIRLAAIFETGYDNESKGMIDFTTGGHDIFVPDSNFDKEEGIT